MSFKKKPPWLRMPSRGSHDAARIRSILNKYSLNTVCRQAMCPNLGHCFQRGTATFLILGHRCTRSCRYCAIESSTEHLDMPDSDEPDRIAEASAEMGLKYLVITSVTRDDLSDGGALHFAKTISAVKKRIPGIVIEVLTPDFRGDAESIEIIANAEPDVFNHNLETVERLFADIRPEASYRISLDLFDTYAGISPSTPLKSGIMLGLGEIDDEIRTALLDLRKKGVSMITLGQYLQPSRSHWPVDRYLTPGEFKAWKEEALSMGFFSVSSGPLVRSSFHADENFQD